MMLQELLDGKDLRHSLIEDRDNPTCLKKFGKYLFGEFKKFYKKELEVDNPEESEIFDYVDSWLSGEYVGKTVDNKLVDAFKLLMKCKKTYPEILQSKALTLYRGLSLPLIQFKDVEFEKKVSKVKLWKYSTRVGIISYKAKSKVQSWTPDIQTAYGFARGGVSMPWEIEKGGLKSKINLVLEYTFKDKDLLFSIDFMKSFWGGKENEVIRVGDNKIDCKVYVLTPISRAIEKLLRKVYK